MNTLKISIIAMAILIVLLGMYALTTTAILVDQYTRPAAVHTAQYGAKQFYAQLTAQAK